MNSGKDKEQEVGTDKEVSIVHWVNGPKILNKALHDSERFKYIDKQQCKLLSE